MIDIALLLELSLYLFVGFGFLQILYFLFFYTRVIFWKRKVNINNQAELPSVSVIIAAKNEVKNLRINLESFLKQDYPSFKVIVVDDGSQDESATFLAEMSLKYSNLYVTRLPEDDRFQHGKKTALTVGIKASQADIMLFSDADCSVVSENWIKTIVENYTENTEFVISYGGYKNQKGLLNKIIRSDTVFIGLQYLSFALAGIPYMAVGRNMSYKKSMFLSKKGFANHMNLLSGSDDLFVNQNANRKNLSVDISPESFTVSETKHTMQDWYSQKVRHLTTGKYYKFFHKLLLFLEPFSRIVFFISGIILLSFNKFVIIVSAIIAFRFILLLIILILTNKKFNEKKILIIELLYDILQPIFSLVFYLNANKKKEFLWK